MEKRETGLPEFYPQEVDIMNFNLSMLFSHAAMGVDNYILNNISEDEYQAVIRSGRILYQYAEKAKSGKSDMVSDSFFLKVLQELREKPKTIEDVANSVMRLGLDLIKLRELPTQRQEELRGLCVLLSQTARNKWQEYNPTGFRRYAA